MDPLSIFLFVILFALSAFFSGSEIAFMSLPKHKIDAFVKAKKRGAKTLKKLKNNNEKLLITILIGNNLVNVITASLATKISIDLARNSGMDEGLMIGIATGIITLLILVFGEIFPKTLATRYAEKISLFVANIYKILQYILRPLVISIEFLMNKLHKPSDEISMSEEEIYSFIKMGKDAGALDEDEYKKVKNMLNFYEITAEEIMTPRIKIEAFKSDISVELALQKMQDFSHSRIPVYEESIDDAEWVVTLRDLVAANQNGKSDRNLASIALPQIIKIPLTKPIHKTLEVFQKQRKHISLVMDEYGGVAGLLSLEDIVEEVFGEFLDETDQEDLPIKKFNNGYYIQPHVRFEEVLQELDISFDDIEDIEISEEEFDGETLSYFITSHLERFPRTGESIILNITKENNIQQQLSIKVLSVDKHTIGQIYVEITQKAK